ncbi:MAG TPA: alpha/beta hydrolase domain-containing protein [Caldimonas sp.]|jgi:hypothetical protein
MPRLKHHRRAARQGLQHGESAAVQERYGTHDGYVAAVRAAADNAACKGYLNAGAAAASMGALCATALPPGAADDWASLVNQAIASDVLK